MDASPIGASISRLIGLERKDAMSAIQIVCAVAYLFALGLSVRGHQGGRYGVSASLLPRIALPGYRAAAYSVRAKRPGRQQFGPIAAISIFLGGLNFGLFYVGLGLGSGSMSAVAYQLATPFTVLLAWPLLADRPSFKLRPPEW